jgi:hypothetical protein
MAHFKAFGFVIAAYYGVGLLAFASASPVPLEPRDLLGPIGPSAWSEQEKWSPALDYDTDSCYNTVAISPSGQFNTGIEPTTPFNELIANCRNANRLKNTNVYVRSKCNNGWCAHMYDYYFESDFAGPGHKHDWEHIAVWVQNGQLKFVSASEHGDWIVRETSRDKILFEQGTHPKIVYHKDGGLTHAFRFADDHDSNAENHWGSWRWGAGAGLIEWDRIVDLIRALLSTKDWGSATMAIKNDKDGGSGHFAGYLDSSRRKAGRLNLAPDFNPWA